MALACLIGYLLMTAGFALVLGPAALIPCGMVLMTVAAAAAVL